MNRPTVLRTLFVIALIGALVLIGGAIYDFATGSVGWSAWTAIICGAILAVVSIYRIIRPYSPAS